MPKINDEGLAELAILVRDGVTLSTHDACDLVEDLLESRRESAEFQRMVVDMEATISAKDAAIRLMSNHQKERLLNISRAIEKEIQSLSAH